MKTMIIHITDLHASSVISYREEKIKSMVDIIKTTNDINSVLMLFSGDIANKGKNNEYELALSFLKEIELKVRELGKEIEFIFCPGNHDRTFQSKGLDISYLNGIDSSNIEEKYYEQKKLNSNYFKFIKKFRGSVKINSFLQKSSFKINNKNISIYSFNNCLFTSCYLEKSKKKEKDDFYGAIYFPNNYIKDIRRENEDFVILLMHMPSDYFDESTKAVFEEVCSRNVDFVFSGHIHKEEIYLGFCDNSFLQIIGDAAFHDDKSGFCSFVLDDDKLIARSYVFNDKEFAYFRKMEPFDIPFTKKTSNSFSIRLRADMEADISSIDSSIDVSTKKLADLFVFPTLSLNRYDDKKFNIESIEEFESKRNNNDVICIIGGESSGKSLLLKHLFFYYLKHNYIPLLCDGNDFKTQNYAKIIGLQLKEHYSNESIDTIFETSDIEKRILLVDNFESVPDAVLSQLLDHFGSIIYTCSDKNSVLDESSLFNLLVLNIEPMYKTKRYELLDKIYTNVSSRRSDLKTIITRSEFKEKFEKITSKLDKIGNIDPLSIIVVANQILNETNNYNSASYETLYRYRVYLKLEQALTKNGLINCSTQVAERIIGTVAFESYEKKITIFDKKIFEKAVKYENKIMKHKPFNKISSFINALCDAGILKPSNEKDDHYSFADRSILSFYIGKYAIEMLNGRKRDPYYVNKIVKSDIYSPLNFAVLMSISTNYGYDVIPSYFVNKLYKKAKHAKSISKSVFKDFADLYNDANKKLILNEEQVKKIKDNQSKKEQQARNEYLKTVDNYYYVEKIESNLKNAIEWTNIMKICNVLLSFYPDSLDGNDKRKLVAMSIKIPNIILYYMMSDIFSNLANYFVEIEELLKDEKQEMTAFEKVKDYLLSLIRSIILSIYHLGYCCFQNNSSYETLKKELSSGKDDISYAQKMMLMSFASSRSDFIKEINHHIDNGTKFDSMCARLIGRAYCLRHYDDIDKIDKSFIDKVTDGNPNSITTEKLKFDPNKK